MPAQHYATGADPWQPYDRGKKVPVPEVPGFGAVMVVAALLVWVRRRWRQ